MRVYLVILSNVLRKLTLKKNVSEKIFSIVIVLIMGFLMSLLMTLIITFINTGMDIYYINRFLKAWTVSLPIAMGKITVKAFKNLRMY